MAHLEHVTLGGKAFEAGRREGGVLVVRTYDLWREHGLAGRKSDEDDVAMRDALRHMGWFRQGAHHECTVADAVMLLHRRGDDACREALMQELEELLHYKEGAAAVDLDPTNEIVRDWQVRRRARAGARECL